MKKAFLFIALVIPFLTQAQRPIEGTQSFTFGVSGLQNIGVNAGASRTGTRLYRKYKTDSMAYRFSAALNIAASSATQVDEGQGMKTITTNNAVSINIAPGFQNSLGGNPRLEPYWGVDFLLGYT